MKPSLYWRNVIRGGFFRPPTDDQEFFDLCTKGHAEAKRGLDVYIMALALLTYGRLDVVDDVLENMPPDRHPANRGLAGAVNQLIPAIPSTLRAGTSPQEVLAWIRANESHLRWDEDAGHFVLTSSD